MKWCLVEFQIETTDAILIKFSFTASETIERRSVYEASAEIDKNVNTFSVKMKGECRHQKLRMIINLDCGMQERQAGTVGQTHFTTLQSMMNAKLSKERF